VDAYPNDQFIGEVTQVRLKSTVTSNVVTYEVIVNAPNENLKLKPGLTANITIYTVEKSDILTLPNKVFSFKPDIDALTKKEYIVHEDKQIAAKLKENERIIWVQDGKSIRNKSIVIGDADAINTEVASGLTIKEVVILEQKSLIDESTANTGEKSPFMPSFKGKNGQGGGKK